MRAAVGGTTVLLKVSRELSGVVTHLGDKPSSRPSGRLYFANFTSELTHTQLGDRMLWYLQHKDQLARQDRFLARYSSSCIDKMSTTIRREWIRHLDIAHDAWTREQKTIDTGQTLLTQFFTRTRTI